MVNNQRELTNIFSALADPTRRGILARLSNNAENSVTSLAKPFRMSAPAISRHLRVLQKAKLIDRRRDGRLHMIRARRTGLTEAQSWINQCAAAWEHSFDKLDQLLKNQPRKEKAP